MKKMLTVALTDTTSWDRTEISEYIIKMPSTNKPRIQKAQITVGHIICEIIEPFYPHSYKL